MSRPQTNQQNKIIKISAICLLMGVLYGIANFLSGKYYLPGCSFAELRPQIIIPMFIGIIYGPLPGFLCGGLGDMLGYTIAGKGPFVAIHWSIANGLVGFIAGLARYFGARSVDSIISFVKLLILLLLASSLPFIFATGIEFWQGRTSFHHALFAFFLPIFITDTLWALMFIPPLMQLFKLLVVRIEIRTILAIYYLLIATIMITWLSGVMITMHQQLQIEELYTLGTVTLIILIVGIAVSAVSSKKITAPLISLTNAARRIADGHYSDMEELNNVSDRQDELGTMASVFLKMTQAVAKREEALQKELTTLKIKIDHNKQSSDLKKITDSDYFKMLKKKAVNLRQYSDTK
ncbi:MAG: ECF transporter S component [Pseudomonadota bacterium]|nr:ECF transporter S component [Pseudomonadota bacterium]